MPAYVTHWLFGDAVCQQLRGEPLEKILRQHRAAYDWGTQGPDLLFFRRAYLNPFNKVIQTGVRMHQAPVPPLLNAFLRYLRPRQGTPEGTRCLAYFMGFLTHYVLDRSAHPYVYAMVEKRSTFTAPFEKKGLHHQIESALDTIMCQERLGIRVQNFPLFFGLQNRRVHENVASMLKRVIWEAMGEQIKKQDIVRAFDDALWCEEFLLDSKRCHQGIASFVDRVLVHGSMVTAMRKPEIPPFDAANKARLSWHHLNRPEQISHETFQEIFDKAVPEASSLLGEATAHLRAGSLFEDVPMNSFDHGRPSER